MMKMKPIMIPTR